MPVEKFRTFEEAATALVSRRASRADDDATLPGRIAALWDMSSALTAPLGFRGVRKFRTIEEASDDRNRMTLARPKAR